MLWQRCSWDGGDCCKDTCKDDDDMTFTCEVNSWDTCKDPSVCSVKDPEKLGDGICHDEGNYNTKKCKYDGGDCCHNTCDYEKFGNKCGSKGYTCRDPDGVDDTKTDCEVPDTDRLGDGHCDIEGEYNTQKCNYDGKPALIFSISNPHYYFFDFAY